MRLLTIFILLITTFNLYAIDYAPARDENFIKRAGVPAGKTDKPRKNISISADQGKVLVLLLEFSDKKHDAGKTSEYFKQLVFGVAQGSIRDYYREQSYGNYNMSGYISDWISVSAKYADMGKDSLGDTDNITEIFKAISEGLAILSEKKDLNEFDTNKDGEIDHLIVVHAGNAQEYSGVSTDVWSHRHFVPKSYFSQYPLKMFKLKNTQGYTIQSEFSPMGIFAHEFGHDLGLADLYNSDNGAKIVGTFSLMDYGCWNGNIKDDGKTDGTKPSGLSAWEKIMLGWVTTQETYSENTNIDKTYYILNLNTNNKNSVYKVNLSADKKEYLIIENRQKTGYDSMLPGSGILIYHIYEKDRIVSSAGIAVHYSYEEDFNNNELNMYMKRIKIIEADGNNSIGTSTGDGSDYFHATNMNQLLDRSNNSSNTCLWNGKNYYIKSGINITGISNSGGNMSFVFRRDYSMNFDNTGDVDVDDIALIKSKYGLASTSDNPCFDYNGDEKIDMYDLDIIRSETILDIGGRSW